MKSRLTEDFIECFGDLPESVKSLARKNYGLWKENPSHRSLRFKRIHNKESLDSVRIGRGWRALGLLDDDIITWIWIGSHDEYERRIR